MNYKSPKQNNAENTKLSMFSQFYLKPSQTKVSLNARTHPCSTQYELIKPIHHSDWINLPFKGTRPL